MKHGKNKQKSKIASRSPERRFLANGELRVKKEANGKSKIIGYAAKFAPIQSDNLGGFFEQLDPRCFDACLASNPDVRGLWNHDTNHVLGRTTAGTLRLSVDNAGLKYEIDPPDTNMARDIMVSMERGDITQSSFGFICTDDIWREDGNGKIVRTVLKAELFDVSPVTFPAYPDATSGVRASLCSCPANLRSKINRDEDDDTEEDDDLGSMNDEGDDGDDEDVCACDCDACQAGDCDDCTDVDCGDDNCTCDYSQRQAHLQLLTRRLRF